ncbi:MAG: transporter substrate-binding domain-containing protein [Lachnospiraceae bacterium]|nr:transporter substrate-binding domain-containing protein [Lachnospiraceae bacterium]
MKKLKTLLGLLLTFVLTFSLAACGSSGSADTSEPASDSDATASESAESTDTASDDSDSAIYRTLDEIKESGSINIGVFSDKNPFGYVDENGEYQGYDVYFANRIGEDLGVDVNFVSTEAANRVEYLETGKVDIILANFTVTEERAQSVDFALPYMNVALGVVSPDDRVISDLSDLNEDDEVIVISGTTAETYLIENNPEIKLQKYDTYANAKNALEDGNAAAWANDNTEVIAFSLQNPGYTVGIPTLGSQDTIAPAVSKGNSTLLDWINDEIESLASENFFHKDYEETLIDTYGEEYEESLVVEGGAAAESDTSDAEDESEETTDGEKLTVGASSTPHAELLEMVKPTLAEEGIDLEIVVYDDYVLPNTALDDGTLDANYFQHTPYLESFNESNGTDLVSAGLVHYEPFGIYSETVTDLNDLAEGATILVPDDDSNQTRALLLLAQEGIIELPEDASVESGVTTLYITNDNGYKVQAVQADTVPSILKSADEGTIAVINYNYALGAGFKTDDALAIEDASGDAARTYANVIAVRNGDEDKPAIKALLKALQDGTVEAYNEETGAGIVPIQ